LGFDLNTQVHHCRDEPGIVGAAIYGEILVDQHSKRSHSNKAVDVVVCQTSWIDSGSRFINSGSALHNKSRGDCPLAFGPRDFARFDVSSLFFRELLSFFKVDLLSRF
jgi:hypothetical protein